MEQECQKLRIELKEWEKAFAAANGGRKAGREDIKQHPDIANKYKLYNKLRAGEAHTLSTNAPPTKEQSSKKRPGREPPPASAQTPQKRSKHLHPPQDAITVPEQAPESTQNTPVAHRKSIGPTPQRNGRVLGLFDLLTPSSTFRTPSRRQTLAPLPTNLVATPSRADSKNNDDRQAKPGSSVKRRSKSPPSASKRTYPASSLTPSTRRIVDAGNTPEAAGSVSKLRFDDTPAFLRRDSQRFSQGQNHEAEDEYGNGTPSWILGAMRGMRPKPAGRGLSALVKGLREMEEAKLDEELDMLREMEGEEGTTAKSQIKDSPKICVEDSQIPDMPLGPDGHGGSESDDLEALEAEGKDRNGKPLKLWKKKGQKRTTRRVTIKPNTAKWKPEPEWKGGKDAESDREVAAVEETQLVAVAQDTGASPPFEGLKSDDDYQSEVAFSGDEAQAQIKAETAKQQGRPKKAQKKPSNEKKKKKISATAHANFRALKIKNKNSKAKGRGRFGRRR
ncbi:MAG: hypothetical protein LQ338_006321 [Usnochroma carphineum]|nr:MAG: hypothetical protein LQ338_006321 [Usnochroma carphineum]